MVDKYGAVRAAPKQPSNSSRLDPKPVAHLGPGRALGFTFDAEGNLVVCDALKVSGLCRWGRGGVLQTLAAALSARALAQAAAACAAAAADGRDVSMSSACADALPCRASSNTTWPASRWCC